MKTPWLFPSVLLTALAIVPPAAFAGCDAARWSNPSLLADFPQVGEHQYVALKSAWVNPDGNLQIGTTDFLNDSTGICNLDIVWEIDCRRRASRPLQAISHYDSDWPTDKDSVVEGDKIWKNFGANGPMGRVANMFCGRLNQLPEGLALND